MEVSILLQAWWLTIAARWDNSTLLMEIHGLKLMTMDLNNQDQHVGRNSLTRSYTIRDVRPLVKSAVDLLIQQPLKCHYCILIGIWFHFHLKSITFQNAPIKLKDTINVCQTCKSVMTSYTTFVSMKQHHFGLKLVEILNIQWQNSKEMIVFTEFGMMLAFGWLQQSQASFMLILKNTFLIQSTSSMVLA